MRSVPLSWVRTNNRGTQARLWKTRHYASARAACCKQCVTPVACLLCGASLTHQPFCSPQHDRPQYKYNYRAEKLPEAAPIEVTDVVRQQFRSTMVRGCGCVLAVAWHAHRLTRCLVWCVSQRTTTRMAHVPTHPDLADKPRWDGSTQLLEKEHVERVRWTLEVAWGKVRSTQ